MPAVQPVRGPGCWPRARRRCRRRWCRCWWAARRPWRQGHFRLDVFVAALLGSLLIQIGTNFANDLFDFKKGADTAERLGPTRVTQSGLISPRRQWRGAWSSPSALGGAGRACTWCASAAGPSSSSACCRIAVGHAYTGGPWPLGYHGLGDVFVFVFFGLVAVMGTYYLHTGTVNALALAGVGAGRPAGHGHPGGQQPARHRHRPGRGQAHPGGAHRSRRRRRCSTPSSLWPPTPSPSSWA